MTCTCQVDKLRGWLKEAIQHVIHCEVYGGEPFDLYIVATVVDDKPDEVCVFHDFSHNRRQDKYSCCGTRRGCTVEEFKTATDFVEGWSININDQRVELSTEGSLPLSINVDKSLHLQKHGIQADANCVYCYFYGSEAMDYYDRHEQYKEVAAILRLQATIKPQLDEAKSAATEEATIPDCLACSLRKQRKLEEERTLLMAQVTELDGKLKAAKLRVKALLTS